ncbi:MAG: ATP-binding protein [bacterium]|nr:ATP-binding protein [bacterium]
MDPLQTTPLNVKISRRNRLSVRQTRWALVAAVLLGLVFSFVQLALDLDEEVGRLEKTSRQFLEILDQPASFAAYRRDSKYAKALIVGYFSYQPVYRAELRDADGEILAAQSGALRQGPYRVLVDWLFGPFRSFKKTLNYQAAPDFLMAMANVQEVGEVEVWIDTYNSGKLFLNRVIWVLTAGVLRNLALAGVLLWAFNRYLTRPFVDLTEQLSALDPQKPESGRLNVPLGHESDEFSLIVLRVNYLLESIAGHIDHRISKEREAERLAVELVQRKSRQAEMQAYQAQLEESNVELEQLLAELKNTQDALIESRTMASLGSLVAGVAHELNTPIGIGVTGASSVLSRIVKLEEAHQKGDLSQEDFELYLTKNREMAEIMLANLERASELIQGFKRVAVDQTRFELQDFKLCEYLRATFKSLEPEMKAFKPEVLLQCDEELAIRGYPGALGQVIVNLVQNSLRHGFEEGQAAKITVKVFEVKQKIELTYEDNGKGISPENLPRIFEPFFTTSSGRGGTGLGLHILYNLVRAKMDGDIRVESQLGEGARFILRIPKVLEHANEVTG